MATSRSPFIGVDERQVRRDQENDRRYRNELLGRVYEDDRMRGFDRSVDEYMRRFAGHVEDQMRRMADMADQRFEMIEAKYEREISELQDEVSTMNERLDSVDYYQEDLPEAA